MDLPDLTEPPDLFFETTKALVLIKLLFVGLLGEKDNIASGRPITTILVPAHNHSTLNL